MKTTGNNLAATHEEPLELTADQQLALAQLRAFLTGPEQVFLLRGYAGTGKTTLIKTFLRELGDHPAVLLAPTGRAARIMGQITGQGAATIHRHIYQLNRIETSPDPKAHDRFCFFFPLRGNPDADNTVYIVDEASMIADRYDQQEFFRFGSGKLLPDLLHFVDVKTGGRRKLIFVGDPAQLPPVGQVLSPALDPEHLRKVYDMAPQAIELTQIMRQRDGGVLRCASQVRDAIREKIFARLDFEDGRPEIVPATPEEATRLYAEIAGPRPSLKTVIIAQSNRLVAQYNRMVRAHYFPGQREVMPEDLVIATANNYRHEVEIFNGEFGIVEEVAPAPDTPEEPVFVNVGVDETTGRQHAVRVNLVFRQAVIRFPNPQGGWVKVNCRLIENLLYSDERDLSPEEHKGLYVHFCNRHKDLHRGSEAFRRAMVVDPWFNCLRLKFGYAVTCHKAQGGEWERMIVDFDCSAGRMNEAHFRWVYTALTRTRQGLYALNAPRIGRLPAPSAFPTQLPSGEANNMIRIEPVDIEGLSAPDPFAAAVLHLVSRTLFEAGLALRQHSFHQYALQITCGHSGAVLRLRIHWNRAGQISSIIPMNDGTAAQAARQTALDALRPLEKRRIVVAESAHPIGNPPTATNAAPPAFTPPPGLPPAQHDFVTALVGAAGRQCIAVTQAVAKSPYHLQCAFEGAGDNALVNYYFNGRGACTRAIPDMRQCTVPQLLERILKLSDR